MSNLPLTARQQKVLDAVAEFREVNGYCVTVRELADKFGWSLNGVMCHIHRLKAKGRVTWERGQSRTLRPVR